VSFAALPFADILSTHGETMTLRRLVPGDPPTWIDVAVKGKRRAPTGGRGDELIGTRTEKTLLVTISDREIAAEGWPGPPRKDDVLVIDGRGYTLQDDADTRKDGEVVLAHFLTVAGG
jgi:hypothetical protein